MENQAVVRKLIDVLRFERNRTSRTLKAYEGDLRDLGANLRGRRLTELDTDDLRAYLADLGQRGLKDTTIRRRMATIKIFYRFLEEEGVIPQSPAGRLRVQYTIAKRIPRVMPVSRVEAVLQAAQRATAAASGPPCLARALRDQVVLEILFSTGLRSDEVVRLDLKDVDLERRTLHVSGKGRRERQLYLSSDEVLAIIANYLAHRNAMEPRCNALILNFRGERLHVQSVRAIFQQHLRRADGEPRFTPHCLRHSMATYLIENGADVRSAQDILGHANIQTTQIYLEVSRKRKEAVLAQFNQRNRFSVQP
jgi:integrase/recombinase XerD